MAEKTSKHQMTEKEIVEICKYFWTSDKDGDGKLDKQEFRTMIKKLNIPMSREDVDHAFYTADVDKVQSFFIRTSQFRPRLSVIDFWPLYSQIFPVDIFSLKWKR